MSCKVCGKQYVRSTTERYFDFDEAIIKTINVKLREAKITLKSIFMNTF